MPTLTQVQLGKNGITENFIATLRDHFKKHSNVKVSVLRSFCRDKKELKEIELKMIEMLGKNFTSRSVGYTIMVKKHRREVQKKGAGGPSEKGI